MALVLDSRGSSVDVARETYWYVATGGIFPPTELQRGERMLEDLGLVSRVNEVLHLNPELQLLLDGDPEDALRMLLIRGIASSPAVDQSSIEPLMRSCISDQDQCTAALVAVAWQFDDAFRKLIGDIGEELVVQRARDDLQQRGHPTLARLVRRVSLESDSYGYDVVAPGVSAGDRLLEVKATTIDSDPITVFLSRHEADVGQRLGGWSLVVCSVTDHEARTGDVLGWLPGWSLKPLLPEDSEHGQWASAQLSISRSLLRPDLPSAFG